MARKTLISWSSGKDSAWMLEMLRHDPEREVAGLVTTIGEVGHRVAMHGVHRQLVQRQADSLGLPVQFLSLPEPCSNAEYEASMRDLVASALARGIVDIAFGDLYLEDIRLYRESGLAGTGLTPLFPLWGTTTHELARRMIREGMQAVVVCVDPHLLDPSCAGQLFNENFLRQLPAGVDPCGERGEFHTFVFDGPGFASPVAYTPGTIGERNGFVYCDLLPAGPEGV